MSINIRDIQHYLYCPRRFALLKINRDWVENALVVKANIMHERVHNGTHEFRTKSKVVLSSVAVYNDDLDIYGITNCIEFEKSKNGVFVKQLDGCYNVRIVEYKPTQPKDGAIRKTDAIQVFAQKLCADFVWGCDSEAYICYADTKKRVKLPFDTEYDAYNSLLKEVISGINYINDNNIIPPREKAQKCSGCSLSDKCMPKRAGYSVRRLVMKEGEE